MFLSGVIVTQTESQISTDIVTIKVWSAPRHNSVENIVNSLDKKILITVYFQEESIY